MTTSALETLLFRARRSLAEELQHQLTCTEAQLAVSQSVDGRLGRKERRRLRDHLAECPDCAQFARLQQRHRSALRGLALVPIPLSLTLFKGLEGSASAAVLPISAGAGASASPWRRRRHGRDGSGHGWRPRRRARAQGRSCRGCGRGRRRRRRRRVDQGGREAREDRVALQPSNPARASDKSHHAASPCPATASRVGRHRRRDRRRPASAEADEENAQAKKAKSAGARPDRERSEAQGRRAAQGRRDSARPQQREGDDGATRIHADLTPAAGNPSPGSAAEEGRHRTEGVVCHAQARRTRPRRTGTRAPSANAGGPKER